MRPNKKPCNGRGLAVTLRRLTDSVALAQTFGEKPQIHKARRKLASFQGKMSPAERTALLAYLDQHEPADSASAILLAVSGTV